MLALVSALCPAASRVLDDAVTSQLRHKYEEQARQMAAGATPEGAHSPYEDLFLKCCPRFVPRAGPSGPGAGPGTNKEDYRAQLGRFMAVVEQRKHLPAIKSVLKLYSSIPLAKLASLADLDSAKVEAQLELLRRSASVVTWGGGDALAGAPQACGDLEFSVEDQDGERMVFVQEVNTSRGIKGEGHAQMCGLFGWLVCSCRYCQTLCFVFLAACRAKCSVLIISSPFVLD
jgi:hypothetical protein